MFLKPQWISSRNTRNLCQGHQLEGRIYVIRIDFSQAVLASVLGILSIFCLQKRHVFLLFFSPFFFRGCRPSKDLQRQTSMKQTERPDAISYLNALALNRKSPHGGGQTLAHMHSLTILCNGKQSFYKVSNRSCWWIHELITDLCACVCAFSMTNRSKSVVCCPVVCCPITTGLCHHGFMWLEDLDWSQNEIFTLTFDCLCWTFKEFIGSQWSSLCVFFLFFFFLAMQI